MLIVEIRVTKIPQHPIKNGSPCVVNIRVRESANAKMVIAFILFLFGLYIHRKKVSKNLKTDQINLDQNIAP
jgi:hypothetical protein